MSSVVDPVEQVYGQVAPRLGWTLTEDERAEADVYCVVRAEIGVDPGLMPG